MQITHATWEKRNLGCDAYEITIDRSDLRDVQGTIRAIAARGFNDAYVLVKMPVGNLAMLHALEDDGFRFLETQLYIVDRFRPLEGHEVFQSLNQGVRRVEVPKERAAWERVINLITPGMFVADRISLDPMFGQETSCRRYQNWVRDLFDAPGSVLAVLEADGAEIGFDVSIHEGGGEEGILSGVFKEYKGAGFGNLLMFFDSKRHHGKRKGTISSNNLPVLRSNQYAGMVIYKEAYVLRKVYPPMTSDERSAG